MAVHADDYFCQFAAIVGIDQKQRVLFLVRHDQETASGRRGLCDSEHP